MIDTRPHLNDLREAFKFEKTYIACLFITLTGYHNNSYKRFWEGF